MTPDIPQTRRIHRILDIPAELEALEGALVEAGGDLTPELEARFQALLEEGADKLDGAAAFVRELGIREEAHKAEAQAQRDKAQRAAYAADRLRALMLAAVEALGGRVQTRRYLLWTQANAPSVSVELEPGVEPGNLPAVFQRVTLDRSAVLDAAKAGRALPEGVSLVMNQGRHLRIR